MGNSECNKAITVFDLMQNSQVPFDAITMVSLLQACSSLGVLQRGRWIHEQIVMNHMKINVYLGAALINMYARCGCIEESRKVFDEMPFKDLRKEVSGFVKSQGRRRTEWKIFETSGSAAGQKTAFGLLTYGAHLSVVGFTMDTVDIRLSNLMAFHATAMGNWGCLPKYYPPTLDLVLSGKVQLSPFVKTYPLDEINEVFETVHHRKILERAIMVP